MLDAAAHVSLASNTCAFESGHLRSIHAAQSLPFFNYFIVSTVCASPMAPKAVPSLHQLLAVTRDRERSHNLIRFFVIPGCVFKLNWTYHRAVSTMITPILSTLLLGFPPILNFCFSTMADRTRGEQALTSASTAPLRLLIS